MPATSRMTPLWRRATPEVIETYLKRERARFDRHDSREVNIVSVDLRSAAGPVLHFRPGEKAWVDVRFAAVQPCERVAVVLSFLGEGLDEIFNTSSERLGLAPMDLRAGEARSVRFELDMHLAPGTYHVAVYLGRTDVPLSGFRPQPSEIRELRYATAGEVDALLLRGELAPNMAFLWLTRGLELLALADGGRR